MDTEILPEDIQTLQNSEKSPHPLDDFEIFELEMIDIICLQHDQ